ncbi:MAG TPA: hypothetical protein VMU67_10225 [Steroidobacteraceae bacterium]|nr:hypothetical protein [Steroidobacteraceae bacterium]
MAIYTGSPTSASRIQWDQLDAAERNRRQAAGIKAWQEWGARHRAEIEDGGGPLGKTQRVSREGTADIRNHMAGFVIVRAESQEAAARLFDDHPHFSVFPGDGVEIMECLPVPGQ